MKVNREILHKVLPTLQEQDGVIFICAVKTYCDIVDIYPKFSDRFTYSFYILDEDVFYKSVNIPNNIIKRIDYDSNGN